MLKNFRTYQLAKEYYQLSLNLKFKGTVKNQFDRAVLSIVLNLAEGAGKPTLNDRKKYFFNAFGSLREKQAILEITDSDQVLKQKADQLAAHLYWLCQCPGKDFIQAAENRKNR